MVNIQARPTTFERLKHALQALAMAPDIQIRLFPEFVCKANEMVFEFELWHERLIGKASDALSDSQKSQLIAIEDTIAAMSEADNQLWSDDGLRSRPEWERLRSLARSALQTFGWPLEKPPSYLNEFNPARRSGSGHGSR